MASNDEVSTEAVASSFSGRAGRDSRAAHTPGDIVYAPDGRKCEFVALSGHGVVIRRGYSVPSQYGDEPDEYFEELAVVDRVYPKPPMPVFAAEIEKLKAEAEALREQIQKMSASRREIERDNTAFLKRAAKYSELAELDAFISGKLTHFVTCQYGQVKIIELGSAVCDYDKRSIKLLTLFGTTGGNLRWRLNSYKDGSGGDEDVWPCTSYEAARETATRLIKDGLTDAPPDRAYHLKRYAESARAIGMDVPAEIVAIIRADDEKSLKKQIAELDQKRAVFSAQLAALDGAATQDVARNAD